MQTNNTLREALANLVDVIDRCDSGSPLWWHGGAKGVMPLKNAKATLAEPVRNYEVGTAEEQAKRMDAYCASHGERMGGGWRCDNCPLCSVNRCELAWAQMPYEGGTSHRGPLRSNPL